MRTAAGGSRLGKLTEMQLPAPAAHLKGTTRCYRAGGGCSIMVGREPARAAPGGIWLPPQELELWHLSIAHPERYPTWDEIADARYELCPEEITMAMLLPPPGSYLNEHEYCFHLWQIEDRRVEGA